MINYLCEIEQNGKIIKETRKNIAIKEINAPKEIRTKIIFLYAMENLYKEYIGEENTTLKITEWEGEIEKI